jgi:hypothetical protein
MNGAKFYLQSGFDTVERCIERSEGENELSSAELSQEMVSWAIFDVQAWELPLSFMENTNVGIDSLRRSTERHLTGRYLRLNAARQNRQPDLIRMWNGSPILSTFRFLVHTTIQPFGIEVH